jgi:cytoskeleton protein RodZ
MGAMCELGQRLREAREAKGLDVAAAAEALKIRRVLLLALEDCRFEELPEPALARGYLRRYAQLLGLDPAPLLLMYPSKVAGPPPVTYPATTAPSPVRPVQRGRWWWLLPLVVGALGWYGWRTLSTQNPPAPVLAPAAPVVPPPPAQVSLRVVTQPAGARVYLDGFLLGQAPVETRVEAGERTLRVEAKGFQSYQQVIALAGNRNLSIALKPAAPAPTDPNPAKPAGQTDAANPNPPTPSTGLVLRFEGSSWVRVTTPGGTQLFEGQPGKGTQQTYPLPVVVRVGNAQAVRVIVNGQDRGLMGGVGEVVTRRFGQ